MDSFELMTAISDLIRGKDREIWHEILERTLKHEDPYTVRASQVKIIDVVWPEDIKPKNLITHLQEKKCVIDEKLVAAFELEKKREYFRYLEVIPIQHVQAMIRFDPSAFGVEYNTCESAAFGFDATISYQKVVDAALKYGFKQPDFTAALYLRNRFWGAHQYTEGTRYYIGCRPLVYEVDKPPVIPVLDYDRYLGWSMQAQEVTPDTLLNMSVAVGQGEYHESTFIFALPQPQ